MTRRMQAAALCLLALCLLAGQAAAAELPEGLARAAPAAAALVSGNCSSACRMVRSSFFLSENQWGNI